MAQVAPPREIGIELIIRERSNESQYVFGRIVSVAAALDGRVYVLDGQECSARVFSRSGDFVKALGTRGGGPGEFQCPGTQLIAVGSELLARNRLTGRIARYTLDGTHIATTQGVAAPRDAVNVSKYDMRFDAEIRVTDALIGYRSGPEQRRYYVVEARTHAGSRAEPLARFHSGMAYVAPKNDPSFVLHTWSGFGIAGAWAIHGDSILAIADGYSGVVKWFVSTSAGLRLARQDSVHSISRPVSPSDLAALARRWQQIELTGRFTAGVDVVEAPSRWSVANRAFFTSDGALWVGGVAQGGHIRWNVFPATGSRFAIDVPSDFWLDAVVSDRLYGYANDAANGPEVRVYRVRGG